MLSPTKISLCIFFFSMAVLQTSLLLAEEIVWTDPHTKMPLPEEDWRKAKNSFVGSIIVTNDKDWEKKWYGPANVPPALVMVSEIKIGQKANILSFFGNPKVGANGKVKIICGIKVVRPDGSLLADQQDLVCFEQKLSPTALKKIQLTHAVVEFMGEEGDKPGTYEVYFSLTDANRQTKLELETKFALTK